MIKEIEKETINLIQQFENPENTIIASDSKIDNPAEDLGKNLFSFFKQRLEKITNIEDTKKIVLEKLIIKMNNDEVTFSQLANFFINLSEQGSLASEQIISLLRPTQGSMNNPFSSIFNKDLGNKDKMGADSTSYTPEVQRKVDKVFRFLETLSDKYSDK